ncbi:hypothetical protein IPA_07695 [Ignicoccus pacificus DSM 13166]|uniref:Uncharacterized protein n=1 Tax=Ignicoccus pacificus DSM 13166 TaxID=940294 RepID=A0A977KCM9_9CREN|nr:hypothetical protein IPA_07695 [Ignicoccus pacificus DSM 13166]
MCGEDEIVCLKGDGFVCCDKGDIFSGKLKTSLSFLAEVRGGHVRVDANDSYALLGEFNTDEHDLKLCIFSKVKLDTMGWDLKLDDEGMKAIIVGRSNCVYIVSVFGEILSKICRDGKEFRGVDYYNDIFAAVDWNGHLILMDRNNRVLSELMVPSSFTIYLLSNGNVLACGASKCALVKGRKIIWSLRGWYEGYPALFNEYLVLPEAFNKSIKIIDRKSGVLIKEIRLGEIAWDADACEDMLLVSTENSIFAFNKKFEIVKEIVGLNGGWRVSFSANCKYFAVSDYNNKRLLIFDRNFNKVIEKRYPSRVLGLDWKNSTLVLGLEDGTVYFYKTIGSKGDRTIDNKREFDPPYYQYRPLALDLVSLALEYQGEERRKVLEMARELLKEDDSALQVVQNMLKQEEYRERVH